MPEPDPTPAEQQVRRLLAEARHDEPLPDDVATRLDGVLSDLGSEVPSTTPVIDLAARRRRRIARSLLVAAAAVVVVGVGISRVDLDGAGSGAAGSSDSDAGGSSSVPESASDGAGDAAQAPAAGRRSVLRLGSQSFDRDLGRAEAQRGLDFLLQDGVSTESHDATEGLSSALAGAAVPAQWCESASWGRGRRVAVRYDGERGVLVLRRPAGGSRQVDLYLCGQTTPTRSATIPAG